MEPVRHEKHVAGFAEQRRTLERVSARPDRRRWIVPAVVAAGVAFFTLGPDVVPGGLLERLAHGSAYATLAGSVAWAGRARTFRVYALLWVAAAALGACMEGAQTLVHRDAQVIDELVNMTGALIGLGAAATLRLSRRNGLRRSIHLLVLTATIVATIGAPAHAAQTLMYVDKNNSACTDSGTGTASQPFCTISGASSKVGPGKTVEVLAGTYSEKVTVGNSGTVDAPVIFEAAPGAAVTVTGGVNAFVLYSRSYVTIRGFTITGTSSYGVYLWYSTNITIQGNDVSYSGQPVSGSTAVGMYIKGTTDSLIVGNTVHHCSDSGIYLTTDTTRVEVRGNTTYSNARGYTRAAPGIDVRALGNTIDGNHAYQNEDSGIQIYNGANNNAVFNNLSHDNGDHGIDVLGSTGAIITGNTVYKNYTAGINVEGGSTGAHIENNVSVDNGWGSSGQKGNIRIDSNSITGSTADYDLVNLTFSGTMMTWSSTGYSTLAGFVSASGQETHGIQADPTFVSAPSGNFHLLAGSPAIDSADSGALDQTSTDIESNPRIDDPATANTGAGSRTYDDRGAYEYQTGTGTDSPPVVSFTATPSSGSAPLSVSVNASASTDADATPISSYTFDFGDGTTVGPQASALASHSYAGPGSFTLTVRATDTAALVGTGTRQISVTPYLDEVHYSYVDASTVAFDWRGTPSDIRFGPTTSYGTTVTAVHPSLLPFSSTSPYWEATLTGLTAGATYHYSIGGRPDATFRAIPTGNFRFDFEADIGDSVDYSTMAPTQNQIASDAPAFVIAGGDLTYGNTHGQSAVDRHFNDVTPWAASAAYMPAWGNHEWEDPTNDDLRNYKGRFALPHAQAGVGAPSPGCCGEDWGWFDAGGVRFISYPEPYTGSTWSDWQTKAATIMADAQSNSAIHFIVTFGHRPAYSTGAHPGDATLAAILDGFGDTYNKYVLNLNAHSHDYERFAPIHGVTHITAGGGGASLEPTWTSTDARTAFRAMHLEHLRVDVTASSIQVDSVCGPATGLDDTTCTQGSVLDTTTILLDRPPSASLTVTPSSGFAPLAVTADASASTDTDVSGIASYTFDFGDGTVVGPQAGATASHTYTSLGNYSATVTVRDTAGYTSTASRPVSVTQDLAPSASLSLSRSSGTVPLAITADASASTDTDGTPISTYTFDFGDGTVVGPQAGATASHTYSATGPYTVTVTVTDTAAHSATATRTVTVNPDGAPSASISLTPSSGYAPQTVTADASASTDADDTPISTYTFNFGDGTVIGPQAGSSATHTITAPGTYTVSVTVRDTAGLSSSASQSITIAPDQAPSAGLSVTPSSGYLNLPVSADASGSGDGDNTPIASYRFDFGDGTVVGPGPASSANHTYTTVGTFTVTLTVVDTAGLSATTTRTVTTQAYVSNPDFESSLTGWAGGTASSTLTRVAGGHTGSYAVRVTNSSSSRNECNLNDSPNWVATTRAGTYTATLWVKGASGQLRLRWREYRGSSSAGSSTTQVKLNGTWQRVQVTYTSTGSSTLDLNAYISNAPSGTCFDADDASILAT